MLDAGIKISQRASPQADGGRASDYFLYVKGNEPTLQRAIQLAEYDGKDAVLLGPADLGRDASAAAAEEAGR